MTSKTRKDQRVAVSRPVKVRQQDGTLVPGCVIRNLSAGGMLFTSPRALFLGDPLTLQFRIEEGAPELELSASISRVVPSEDFYEEPRFQIAVSFPRVSAVRQRQLRRLVMDLTMQLVERMRDFPAFRSMTEFDLLALAGVCHRISLEAGEVLARQGDEARSLFIVHSGVVKLTGGGREGGGESVEVACAGQVFGEVSALIGLPHDLDIAALEDTCLIALSRDGLAFLKRTHPDTALRMLEVIHRFTGMRLRRLTRRFSRRASPV